MLTELYRIGGKNVRITSFYEDVHRLCRAYRTCGEAQISVEITPADIAYERERPDTVRLIEQRSAAVVHDGYLETLAVYRRLSEQIVFDDTVLFHGSAVAVDGVTYLFTAASGTGKSTHTALWRRYFGERALMVNDDKPLLHVTEQGVTVFGTPWDGKHHRSSNIALPLRAICVLTRSEENHIRPLTPREAYPYLLQQILRPRSADGLKKTLELLNTLCTKVPQYLLGCNMEPDAARVAYEGMRERVDGSDG